MRTSQLSAVQTLIKLDLLKRVSWRLNPPRIDLFDGLQSEHQIRVWSAKRKRSLSVLKREVQSAPSSSSEGHRVSGLSERRSVAAPQDFEQLQGLRKML